MLTREDLRRANFKPEDWFISDTAYRLNHDSKPDNDINNDTDDQILLGNAMVLADAVQEMRGVLNFPMRIHSAYRCLPLNRVIGSGDNSQHVKFEAADISCPGFGSPEKIVLYLKEKKFLVDQCLVERSGSQEWVHFSRIASGNRNQFARLINGKFTLIA